MSLRACSLFALLALASACATVSGGSRRVAPEASTDLWVDEVPSDREDAPVLLVPGAAWLREDLAPLARTHRLVFYDLRGRGHSPPVQRAAGMRIEHDVADLETVRARSGAERVSVLGWAYRGGVAVRYALAHPEHVEALVLVSPLPPRREPHWRTFRRGLLARTDAAELARIDDLRTSGQKRRNPELYARRVVDASLHVFVSDPAHISRMLSDPVVLPNLDPDVTAELGGEILDALGNWDWRGELVNVSAPVLLLHGERDLFPLDGSREYAAHLPNARLIELDAVAHMPWLECPDRFFPVVLDFLGKPEGNGAETTGP